MNGYKRGLSAVLGLFLSITGANLALADVADIESTDKISTEASLSLGYRATSVHGAPGRAQEFDSLESGPLFNAKLFTDSGLYHLDFDIDYLNEDDYSAEAHLDTRGLVRLDLRSTRFFHNLDHIPYANGFSGSPSGTTRPAGLLTEGSRADAKYPATAVPRYSTYTFDSSGSPVFADADRMSTGQNPTYRAYYSDQNPGDDYNLRLDFSEAKIKIKCPDYPAHINLSYWRYEKQGEKQLRFSSEGGTSGSCNGCHMQSKTRDIDRVTEEIKASVDAHAGFVDVVLETLHRTFRDREAIPVDTFGVHNRGRTFGDYEHDEDPDSSLTETTLRLNTAPSGGLVGSASFTIGERENRSDLASVGPVKAETDYYKTAADVTYTPSQNWTVNLRYRFLDMDSDNSDYLTAYGNTNTNPLEVRNAMDITRAWYEAIISYRPSNHLTLKGEFRREDIERSNTGPGGEHVSSATNPIVINPEWELPDEEIITRVKLGFNSRLLEKSALKLNGWLAIQQNDDPAYGTSYGDGQELFVGTSYNPSPFWGMQANINLLKQENNDHDLYDFAIEREKEQQTLSLGTWVNPREGLSFDLNYGFFRTVIDQDLLFGASVSHPTGSTPPPPVDYKILDESVDYRQTVQTVTAGMTWQALKDISCRLEGYHIRSKADFSPDFTEQTIVYGRGGTSGYFPGTASSSDLKDISKLDIVQNGLRGRVAWEIDENLTCGVEAAFDDYDEKGNDVFDGSVQSYMASLTYTF